MWGRLGRWATGRCVQAQEDSQNLLAVELSLPASSPEHLFKGKILSQCLLDEWKGVEVSLRASFRNVLRQKGWGRAGVAPMPHVPCHTMWDPVGRQGCGSCPAREQVSGWMLWRDWLSCHLQCPCDSEQTANWDSLSPSSSASNPTCCQCSWESSRRRPRCVGSCRSRGRSKRNF